MYERISTCKSLRYPPALRHVGIKSQLTKTSRQSESSLDTCPKSNPTNSTRNLVSGAIPVRFFFLWEGWEVGSLFTQPANQLYFEDVLQLLTTSCVVSTSLTAFFEMLITFCKFQRLFANCADFLQILKTFCKFRRRFANFDGLWYEYKKVRVPAGA